MGLFSNTHNVYLTHQEFHQLNMDCLIDRDGKQIIDESRVYEKADRWRQFASNGPRGSGDNARTAWRDCLWIDSMYQRLVKEIDKAKGKDICFKAK